MQKQLKTEIRLRCKRCNNREWIYRGSSQHYTTCPICKSSINIRRFLETSKIGGPTSGSNGEEGNE